MNIEDTVLKNFIIECDDSIRWTDSELNRIYGYLKNISLNNGGRIFPDTDLPDEVVQEYLLTTVTDGIQKVLNYYASSIPYSDRTKFYTSTRKFKAPFSFLNPSLYVNKVDINTASDKELASVKGIGKVLAESIKTYRENNGSFNDVSELPEVPGIGEKSFERFKFAVWASTSSGVQFVSPLLAKFKAEPTLRNYFTLIKNTGGSFISSVDSGYIVGGVPNEAALKKLLINEFRKMDEYVAENMFPGFERSKLMRASKIKEMMEEGALAEKIKQNGCRDIHGVTVLDDSEYLFFLEKLIKEAQKRIRVIMFFMPFDEENKSSTYPLLQELVSASNRGVDVRVILDKDREEDVYKSRIINKEAFDFLRGNGVPVVTDTDERLTHSKVVLVDG